MKWRVVSFYTESTPYENEARQLQRSLERNNIPYAIKEVKSLGSWKKNTHYKAIFIKEMLNQFDSDVIWTDVDSVFHTYPDLFDSIDCDIAVHFRNWAHAKNELLSGTMYFTNNKNVRLLVDNWIRMNKKNQQRWDQQNLHYAIRNYKANLNIAKLPIEYCAIFDDPKRRKIKPVIEHFQKSRQYRRKINAN